MPIAKQPEFQLYDNDFIGLRIIYRSVINIQKQNRLSAYAVMILKQWLS